MVNYPLQSFVVLLLFSGFVSLGLVNFMRCFPFGGKREVLCCDERLVVIFWTGSLRRSNDRSNLVQVSILFENIMMAIFVWLSCSYQIMSLFVVVNFCFIPVVI